MASNYPPGYAAYEAQADAAECRDRLLEEAHHQLCEGLVRDGSHATLVAYLGDRLDEVEVIDATLPVVERHLSALQCDKFTLYAAVRDIDFFEPVDSFERYCNALDVACNSDRDFCSAIDDAMRPIYDCIEDRIADAAL